MPHTSPSLRLALLQTDIVWRDPAANFAQLKPQLERLADEGTQLAVMPEMFAHGFCMDAAAIAESTTGPSTEFLQTQAQKLGMHICGSVPIRVEGHTRPVNRFTITHPDGRTGHYDKIHPFSLAGEDLAYAPGRRIEQFEVEGVRITPFICYDLRFANVFWDAGPSTDLFLVIANWPAKRRSAFSQLLRARAIENQAFVAGVNRVGEGDGLTYDGGSCVIDPLGTPLIEAIGQPATLRSELRLENLIRFREKLPFLKDRRTRSIAGDWHPE